MLLDFLLRQYLSEKNPTPFYVQLKDDSNMISITLIPFKF